MHHRHCRHHPSSPPTVADNDNTFDDFLETACQNVRVLLRAQTGVVVHVVGGYGQHVRENVARVVIFRDLVVVVVAVAVVADNNDGQEQFRQVFVSYNPCCNPVVVAFLL